ncbi:hypothetical protein AVEN_147484-1 [Araneus ventricosus]|uniref:Uncharacterized protein n=1 Tax=Araneus ventricosus TaxID=182803 RepID=A0A4Y2IDY1_ARAVE|nr:hypothetical protein AVEN_147484-1 [Araneus ventricosus]
MAKMKGEVRHTEARHFFTIQDGVGNAKGICYRPVNYVKEKDTPDEMYNTDRMDPVARITTVQVLCSMADTMMASRYQQQTFGILMECWRKINVQRTCHLR